MGIHVRGSCHQGDSKFEGRGRQCTAMAMRALAHHHVKNVTLWTTEDMDHILEEGDKLYMEAADTHDVTLLLPSEAVQNITIDDRNITLNVHKTHTGMLCGTAAASEEGTSSWGGNDVDTLQNAIKQIEQTGALTFGGVFSSYCIGIIQEESTFYVFDSHSRDERGMCHPDGVACVTKHEGMGRVLRFIHDLSQSLQLPKDCLFEVANVTACVAVVGETVKQKDCVDECDLDPSVSMSWDDDDDVPLIHLQQTRVPQYGEGSDERNEESDLDVPLAEVKRHSSRNEMVTDSNTPSDIQSDGEEYVPTKEDMKNLEYSSTEMSSDDAADDLLSSHVRNTTEKEKSASIPKDPSSPESLRKEKDGSCAGVSLDESATSCNTIGSPTAGTSIEGRSPYFNEREQPRQSRKRIRNIDAWNINVRKRLRNSGESYVTRKGKTQRKRELKTGCVEFCRNKCRAKISEDQRTMVFHSFWKMGCLTQQRDYLCKAVKKVEKKTALTKPGSRRNSTYEYCLIIQGKCIKVCKKMFLDTLDISETVVFTALKKSTCLGTCDAERRGKHTQRCNSKATEKEEIRQHINSFPRVESHYARKDSKREYLESSLSLLKMYAMYVEKRQRDGCKTPASETTYRNVFNHDFNISFHKRMKDRCDVCAAYENGHFSESDQQDYAEHIELKEESRKFKDEVKASLKHYQSIAAAVFDLEEVLPTPSSTESSLYYKRKLNTYNLTIYDYRNGQGYCNVWPQTEALRGSNEIASCVYRYLERMSRNGAKKVVLFSDSCGGQNRNKNFLSMLWYALQKLQFAELEHVFFVSGHSQNEGDSMHSVIERSSRNVPVYIPTQWAQLMRSAKRKAPLYIVDELDRSHFLDFKKVAAILKNFQLDTQKEKIRWLKVKRFKLSSEEPNVVSVYYDYTEKCCKLNLLHKLRTVHTVPNPAAIDLQTVSQNPYPISKEKYADLISLCTSNIIPRPHHQYYRSLPHDN